MIPLIIIFLLAWIALNTYKPTPEQQEANAAWILPIFKAIVWAVAGVIVLAIVLAILLAAKWVLPTILGDCTNIPRWEWVLFFLLVIGIPICSVVTVKSLG